MARLPAFLTALSPIGETLAATEQGAVLLEQETARRNAQLSAATATDALPLWEADYGLPGGADTAARRARIRAAMAGGQTLTPARLEALAVTLGGADAGETEKDFAAWRVKLLALFENRVPADYAALEEAVQRLCPAHLEVTVAPVCRLRENTLRSVALTGGAFLHLTGRDA